MISNLIQEKATKLLHAAGQFQAPVDIEACAAFLGVKIERAELNNDILGIFLLKDNSPYIIINSNDKNQHRSRFTIAHELGHFVLHSKDTLLFIDKSKIVCKSLSDSTLDDIKEKEANEFAVSLLAPDELLEKEAAAVSATAGENIVRNLSKKFNISETPIGIRLSLLGLLEYGFSSDKLAV